MHLAYLSVHKAVLRAISKL